MSWICLHLIRSSITPASITNMLLVMAIIYFFFTFLVSIMEIIVKNSQELCCAYCDDPWVWQDLSIWVLFWIGYGIWWYFNRNWVMLAYDIWSFAIFSGYSQPVMSIVLAWSLFLHWCIIVLLLSLNNCYIYCMKCVCKYNDYYGIELVMKPYFQNKVRL